MNIGSGNATGILSIPGHVMGPRPLLIFRRHLDWHGDGYQCGKAFEMGHERTSYLAVWLQHCDGTLVTKNPDACRKLLSILLPKPSRFET